MHGPLNARSPRNQWVGQKPISGNDDGDLFGRYISSADLDGDGAAELLVGAPGDRTSGGTNAGRAYVFRTPPQRMEAWYSIDQRNIDY